MHTYICIYIYILYIDNRYRGKYIDGYYRCTYNISIHKWFKHDKYLLNVFTVKKCIDLTHTTRRWLVTYNVPFFPGVQIASETVFRPLNLSLMTPGNVLVLAVTWNFGCCVGNWLPAWMGWLRFFWLSNLYIEKVGESFGSHCWYRRMFLRLDHCLLTLQNEGLKISIVPFFPFFFLYPVSPWWNRVVNDGNIRTLPWPLFTHTRSLARLARPRLPRYCNVQFGQRWSEHFRASPSSVVAHSRDLRPLLLCHWWIWWLASGPNAHRERGGQCGRRLLQSSASEGFGGVGCACHG